MRFLNLILLASLSTFFFSCSDDDEGTEYLFDREVMEMSVLRSCADAKDTSSCYRVRFRYPIETKRLESIVMWLDTLVVDDTSKSVNSKQIDKATEVYEYASGNSGTFDTIDLTEYVKEYLDLYDSVQVALFCKYSGGDPGSVQRLFLHFGDDIAPSRVALQDSVWTTGAMFEWSRPTDQTDFYSPSELSGTIVGYNVVLYTMNPDEDIRTVKVTLETPYGTDSKGKTYFKRHARVRANGDSVWIDSVTHGDKVKNYLRIAVIDGNGFDFEADSMNRYRMVVEGLRPESKYTIGISSWDASGNSSGNEGTTTVENNKVFMTTDTIAPLMPTKIFTLEDTLFPGFARLDSNNRLRIFWSQSLDPYKKYHGIGVDSVLTVPGDCFFLRCYDTVASYVVDYYDRMTKEWVAYSDVGGTGRYAKLYKMNHGKMEVSSTGTFVTDTIRWVAPGDTLILRIRSVDKSGYYSVALIDTVAVSPGALAKQVECPEGFVAVSVDDTSVFCMERLEHRDDSGKFVRNVLHSEAEAACEAIAADGFKVSLCEERDWERVCLSGGSLTYGVVEDGNVDATEYLFSYCNVGTNDSTVAADFAKRNYRCMNPMGVRDMPGQFQEWVKGRSKDTAAVLKGSSYLIYDGLDRESLSQCVTRAIPYYTRPSYTLDSVFLYREGAKVDTVYEEDTTRTLYKVLTKKDFRDSLQLFDVKDADGNVVGTDYALYSEYKRGGKAWLDTIANGMTYVPKKIKVVFLTGEREPYREAASFYKSTTIGFRCCAYPE